MTDYREHIMSTECWCRPLIVSTSSRAPVDGTVVMATPLALDQVALHIEAKEAEPA